MIGVVAGFYLYARYRVQRAVHDLPAKLGADIQQNTQGFTYSQSAGGHTIYSISASNAVRYKQGGKAELHNVKIVSYGRNSDRLDEITGDDFEYDAQTGRNRQRKSRHSVAGGRTGKLKTGRASSE